MNSLELKKLEAYNQAKEICEAYHNYKGDKRRSCYKRLQANCVDLWIHRMDNFAKELDLPTYVEYFFEGKRVEKVKESAAQAEETNQQENNVMRTINNEKLTLVLTSAMSQSNLFATSKVAKIVGIEAYSVEWGKLADIMSSFIEEANNILPADHVIESREMEKDLDNIFAETKERIISLIEK